MGPKAYAIKNAGTATKETSWMDRMCQKFENYCDLGEPGRGPSIFLQDIEVHVKSIGAGLSKGLSKFASEANDLLQEVLNVPTLTTDGTDEKTVDLPKQRDLKVLQSEKQLAKQAAAPRNAFDEACGKTSLKGEVKEGCDTALNYNLKVLSVKDNVNSTYGEVIWDWPQQPFDDSSEARVEKRLLQEAGQDSNSSVILAEAAVDPVENAKVVLQAEKNDIAEGGEGSNEMVEGEERSAVAWSPPDDVWTSQIDKTTEASLLDGWEGDDIVINEEDLEPDSWHDWELV